MENFAKQMLFYISKNYERCSKGSDSRITLPQLMKMSGQSLNYMYTFNTYLQFILGHRSVGELQSDLM